MYLRSICPATNLHLPHLSSPLSFFPLLPPLSFTPSLLGNKNSAIFPFFIFVNFVQSSSSKSKEKTLFFFLFVKLISHSHGEYMLQGETKLLKSTSSISRIVALKPRQVLLAEQKQLRNLKPERTMMKPQQEQLNQNSLKPENKLALLHSVIKYVHESGFGKTFKRFLKEAQVKDDAWKADSFDLEEMYSKYIEQCGDGGTNFKGHKEQEQSASVTMEKDVPIETVSKKQKKKKNEENDDYAKSAICELKTDESMKEVIENKKKKSKLTKRLEVMGDNVNKDAVETTKSKDKSKKQKLSKGAENAMTSDADTAEIELDDSKMKLKEKKRKKKDSVSEKLSDKGTENEGKSQETSENGANKESKKRKRSASDESKDKPVEGVAIEESKRRKTEGLEEAEAVQQGAVNTVLGADGHVGGETTEENGNFSEQKAHTSSIKQFDESTKGELKINGVERSSVQKTAKKQRNGSTEPKKVNAFQRVKVDAVEFADDRLQDNSYWAKEGAEIGYGAKAQEVLGQVKGRDFRHEKTKKKRGSYRGGLIDLHSHSVKFNYSDEE